MVTYFKTIDKHLLAVFYEYEDQQLLKFKREFDRLCSSISKLHGWNYTVRIERWIDNTGNWIKRPLDGYTAMLQVDLTDNNGNLIEMDEDLSTFFETITYIVFDPIRRKYRVFQNEKLVDIRMEIKRFFNNLEKPK